MPEEEEEEEEMLAIPAMSLFYRVLQTIRRYEPDPEIEQQMIDQAMAESMDSYHGTLFRTNSRLILTVPTQSLTDQDLDRMDEHQKKCSLCLDLYVPNDSVHHLPCHHVFHSACIQDAVRHQHASCPICRAAIPTQELARTPSPKLSLS